MKLPSVQYVTDNAAKTFLRFPYALMVAVMACVLSWWLVDLHDVEPEWIKLLLTLSLGVPLMLSLILMRERPPFAKRLPPWIYGPFGFLLMGLLFTTLYLHPAPNFSIYYVQWLVPSIVLVSFAAFFGYGEVNGFWHFNRRLVTRLLLSGLYTLVFFAGVSVALLALDKLLGVDIKDKVYGRLWIFAAYVFFPWHFLAGVPGDFRELQQDDSYPKALKVFTQYLLVPLATVYFFILYVYLGKILFTQVWPSGWVAWLTTSASVLGLITFLLFFPIRDREGNSWISKYSKGFCISALPLLGMLFVSIFKRMDQYGLTERRYFLIVLALWLVGLFLYFILSRAPDIRWVPATFCAVAVLTSFGPWGAYDVSFKSQRARLKGLLEKNGMLVAGKAVKAAKDVSWEDRKQISACLDYAGEYHGLMRLQPLFQEDLGQAADKAQKNRRSKSQATKRVMDPLGLEYVSAWTSPGGEQKFIHYNVKERVPVETKGYSAVLNFQSCGVRSQPCPAKGWRVSLFSHFSVSVRLCKDGSEQMGPSLEGLLKELSARYPEGNGQDVPQTLMTAEARGMKVCFQEISGNWDADKKAFKSLNGSGVLLLE